ncbi:MAG TPA: PIG-L family deacetylase [Thermoanaerobaculia bacterium]|nr:PIG-L family deacetylase [Thermoanaerobaculia bacterium]
MNDPLQPPGAAERVQAGSALVVAPHYDDEVLGCGGLLAQLAASGAAVRVLFLTDGGGTEAPDPDTYRSRRREESAKAAEILGLTGSDHLSLPDTQLDQSLEQIVQGLRRALLSQRPELLLIPSPLEVSRDHRAAFAALHLLLSPLRDDAIFSSLSILLYEINHPAHPDLLVDVSAQAALLAQAMAAYASQEEQHGYLSAALGLRRFRTLTLPAGVDLAEGYRRLAPADFATRSEAQLIRHLGGIPEVLEVREGPMISVVVRTRDRPELLAEALGSLATGAYRRAEVVLVNDGGPAPAVPADYPLPIVRVDLPETQGRAAAAEAGVAAARGDYVAFLDDDDLAAPEHLATLAGLVSAAGVRVAYTDAAVAIYELDPTAGEGGWVCRERRLPYSRDFDPEVLLVDNYIPFNTLLIERRLFAEAGPFDPELPFFEDWDFLIRLAALVPFHHRAQVTCEYRHFRSGGHHVFGETPRERGDFLTVKAKVLGKHAARLTPERLAAAVDTLRAELVAEREATARARREIAAQRQETARHAAELAGLVRAHEGLARERFALEERFHATRGELAALTAGHERLRADAQRLYGEEAKLRAAVDDQTAHLGRTYAEIERLNRAIREMEATRAWRLHRWWHRRS